MFGKLLSIILLLISGNQLIAQKSDSLIITITSRYRQIQANLAQCDTQVRNLNPQVPGEGFAVGYYKMNRMQLLRTTAGKENEKTITDYYFDQGSLIYVHEQHDVYEPYYLTGFGKRKSRRNNNLRDSLVLNHKINRYYFHQNQLIEWLTPSRTLVDLREETNLMAGQNLLTRASTLRGLFSKITN